MHKQNIEICEPKLEVAQLRDELKDASNPRFVRRDEDELPCMVIIDSPDEYYHLILREDDHLILKGRIKELESVNDERKNYKDACKSLGEEVARLRAALLHDRDLQRKCDQLKFELKLHKDALIDERAYKAKEKDDFIQHIKNIRRTVDTYIMSNKGESCDVLRCLADSIDALGSLGRDFYKSEDTGRLRSKKNRKRKKNTVQQK